VGKLDVREIGFDLSQGGMVQDDVDAILLLSSTSPRHEEPLALEAPYGLELARRRALHEATLPFRGGRIRFQENLATLSGEALEARQAVLKELLRDPELRLLVKAFADAAEADPVGLSARRAELLVDWLAEQGVARDRLVPKGCGALRSLTFGKTAADRAMNRRAELVRLAPTAGCAPPW
jgi:outer membrane protein OmpA-like peptidoglycan-associated protein